MPNVANGTLLRNDRDQRDDVQRASDIDGRHLAGLRVEVQVVQSTDLNLDAQEVCVYLLGKAGGGDRRSEKMNTWRKVLLRELFFLRIHLLK